MGPIDYDALLEEAYIKACELDSPNSPDHDELVERIYDELVHKAIEESMK